MTEFKAISTGSTSLAEPVGTKIETANSLSTHSGIERSARVGFDRSQLIPKRTYIEAGIEKLTALCQAVGMEAKTVEITEIFRAMAGNWGDRAVGDISAWQSDVSDDFAPFEFSIAFKDDRAELRILLEAQGVEPSLESNWAAGLQLNQYLATHHNVSLDRFEQIADLFVPTNPAATFSIWHSACFYLDKAPAFKIYLNPQSQRKNLAPAVVEASLGRLGFPRAWAGLAEIAAQRGTDKDEFTYFSLDLASHAHARVKIYLRHHDATVADLEQAFSLAQNYVAGDVTEFCHALTQMQGAFRSKPMASCFAFVEGNDERPTDATLCVPIGYYAPNDLAISERLQQYFSQHHLSTSAYTQALQAFAIRPLDSGCGMHSHISLRRENQQHRVTTYLNPEVHFVRSLEEANPNTAWNQQRSIGETAWHYEKNSIADHPFLQRLQREPVNQTNLWLLFTNGREGIVSHFTRRLASVVGRIDHEHIRCILTKQLNEELGNGDISRVHRKLFDRLVLALEPDKPQSVTDKMSVPSNELSQRLEALYADSNPYTGVGAAIVMEICGKQMDEVMSKEFVTRTNIDLSSLAWLHLHEELEIDHANEALDLAHLIADSDGDGDKEAARQGAELTATALWNFCNGMYRLCFM
jgi:DMATS type aromatic prenyltransferase